MMKKKKKKKKKMKKKGGSRPCLARTSRLRRQLAEGWEN